jgi:hypothetical protein
MAINTQERTIDGRTYTVQQLPARKALKTLNRLGKVFGPALAQAATAVGSSAKLDIAAIDVAKLGGAVEALFANLEDADLDHFVQTFLESSLVDGAPLYAQLDVVFMGKIDGLLKLLAFAVEVNFGNFMRGLGGAVRQLAPAKVPT